jgi:hypothetical protein
MQSWSVTRLRATAAVVCLAGLIGGCATVAVVEPVSQAEIARTESRSGLYQAADAFCEESRDKGLATGETSLTNLGPLFGGSEPVKSYPEIIRASADTPAGVVRRIRTDAADLSEELSRLNIMARTLAGSGHVTREDVASFERVLIHARQGRDSLANALVEVNRRVRNGFDASVELDALDRALGRARTVADDLAAAKTEMMPVRSPVV